MSDTRAKLLATGIIKPSRIENIKVRADAKAKDSRHHELYGTKARKADELVRRSLKGR